MLVMSFKPLLVLLILLILLILLVLLVLVTSLSVAAAVVVDAVEVLDASVGGGVLKMATRLRLGLGLGQRPMRAREQNASETLRRPLPLLSPSP